MTAWDLNDVFVKAGVRPQVIHLMDGRYCLPTSGWVNGEFADIFKSTLEKLGFTEWVENKMDCDKFARLAAGMATACWGATQNTPKAGLAFGQVLYVNSRIGSHAINCYVHRDKHGPALKFIEPQPIHGRPFKEYDLTEAEIASIWSVVI